MIQKQVRILVETPAGIVEGMAEDVPKEWTVEDSVELQDVYSNVAQGAPLIVITSEREHTVIPPSLLQQSIIRIQETSRVVKQVVTAQTNVVSISK